MQFHEDKKKAEDLHQSYFDLPKIRDSGGDLRRLRMLDTVEKKIEATSFGLSRDTACEFLDKADNKMYHLLMIQAVKETPSLDGTVDFLHPIKATLSNAVF